MALPDGLNAQCTASSHASTIVAPDATGLDDGDDTQDQNEISDTASVNVSGNQLLSSTPSLFHCDRNECAASHANGRVTLQTSVSAVYSEVI